MAKELAERIGSRLRQRREELGLNQREVADRMSNAAVTNQHVSNWERGVYRPSDDNLEDLARALETDVAYFMTPEPKPGTADLMGVLGNGEKTQLDRIEVMLREVLTILKQPAQPDAPESDDDVRRLAEGLRFDADPEPRQDVPEVPAAQPGRQHRQGRRPRRAA